MVRGLGARVSGCPVCGGGGLVRAVTREAMPTMQNVVFADHDAALQSPRGVFTLEACPTCGFAWNAAFDQDRLVYDDSYDNNVPSAVMARYYEEIARYLGERYPLTDGEVVDVGCGAGTFLKVLCRMWPECRAIGVDPALKADESHCDGRLRLVKGVFVPGLLAAPPSLIVCRHVLEHMPDPVAFARDLHAVGGGRPGVPLFLEVPDLDWILDAHAFWDFCYEHCNYFGEASLRAALTQAGFAVRGTRVAYGGQYRWIEAVTTAATKPVAGVESRQPLARLTAYAALEREQIATARARLAALKTDGADVAIWGMATKGVVYSLLVDPDSTLIDFTIDINVNKQGRYVPATGRRIEAPAALTAARGRHLVVVVMNPNYVDEIRSAVTGLGLAAVFVDASGVELVTA